MSPVTQVANDLFQVLGYVLILVFGTFVTWAAAKLKSKWGIEVPLTWQAKVNQEVDNAVAYAEEQGNKAVAGAPVSGNDKLNIALKFLLSMTDDKQLVQLGEDKIKQLIEARVNVARPMMMTMKSGVPIHGIEVVTAPNQTK